MFAKLGNSTIEVTISTIFHWQVGLRENRKRSMFLFAAGVLRTRRKSFRSSESREHAEKL